MGAGIDKDERFDRRVRWRQNNGCTTPHSGADFFLEMEVSRFGFGAGAMPPHAAVVGRGATESPDAVSLLVLFRTRDDVKATTAVRRHCDASSSPWLLAGVGILGNGTLGPLGCCSLVDAKFAQSNLVNK